MSRRRYETQSAPCLSAESAISFPLSCVCLYFTEGTLNLCQYDKAKQRWDERPRAFMCLFTSPIPYIRFKDAACDICHIFCLENLSPKKHCSKKSNRKEVVGRKHEPHTYTFSCCSSVRKKQKTFLI